jgi:hypothetical protein
MSGAWDAAYAQQLRGKVPCARCQDTLVWASDKTPGAPDTLCDRCVKIINGGTEAQLRAAWTDRLERHFHVKPEVWGKHCSGRNMRIDAIIWPRDTTEWKNKKVAFGIEFKSEEKAEKATLSGDGSRWLAQCADYAHCTWEGFEGHLYVLLAGGFNPGPIHSGGHADNYLPRLAYHLGCGELKQDTRSGLSIVFAGEQRVWTEAEGPGLAKRSFLERKWGSR